jgi:REP element-mobilizing transposase RayT
MLRPNRQPPEHYQGIKLSRQMLRPNRRKQPGSLGAIIQNFKSTSTRRANQINTSFGLPLWQRNYFERVIRDEAELARIVAYIHANPARWQEDKEL